MTVLREGIDDPGGQTYDPAVDGMINMHKGVPGITRPSFPGPGLGWPVRPAMRGWIA